MQREFSRSFHFEAEGHSFRIQNFYDENRSGFNHTSVVFMDGLHLVPGEARCHYINRTWEAYGYQSSAMAAIHNAIDYYTESAKRLFKLNNNLSRMTKTATENFVCELQNNKLISGLHAALAVLSAGQPQTVYSWEV